GAGSRSGGGRAARWADAAGRARVEVTVLGAEEYEPYNRVLLSEVVAGKVDVAAIGLPGAGDARVRVRRGTEAIAIDRAARRVVTGEGAHPYDIVMLATGAAARVPDVPRLTDQLTGAAEPRGRVRRGTEAPASARAASRLVTGEGAQPYDVVVLATGAAARVPDVPGLTDQPGGLPGGAHALRTLDVAREVVGASV